MNDDIPPHPDYPAGYRSCPIHDAQPRERVEQTVMPEIDRALALDDIGALFDFAKGAHNCPEARLLAAAKIEAAWELAAAERRLRPGINLELVRAVVSGLDSRDWRDPECYGSLLDHRVPGAQSVPREVPLDDDGSVVEGLPARRCRSVREHAAETGSRAGA